MEKSEIATIRLLLIDAEKMEQEKTETSAFDSAYYSGMAQAFREVLALVGDFQ